MILCQNFSHNLSICWYMLMFSKSGNKKRKVKIGSDQHRRNSRWNRSASSSHSVNPFNCWGPFWLYQLINFEGWPWLTSQLINQGTYIYIYMYIYIYIYEWVRTWNCGNSVSLCGKISGAFASCFWWTMWCPQEFHRWVFGMAQHGTAWHVAEEGGELELFPNPTGYDYNEARILLTRNNTHQQFFPKKRRGEA